MDKISGDVELLKALNKVKTADRIRVVTMILTLLLVLLVFFGNKFAMSTVWYPAARQWIYGILFVTALVMLAATMIKMFLAAKYRQLENQTKM